MHWRVETPQGPMHRGVTKVDPLKNPEWSYALGSQDSPVSYAMGSQDSSVSYALVCRDSPVSYVPESQGSQTKFSQIVDNYVTYNLWKFQIDSFKIKA